MKKEDCLIFARKEQAPILGITFVYVSVIHNDEGEVSPGGGHVHC